MVHFLLAAYLYSALTVGLSYPILKCIYRHDALAAALTRQHHFELSDHIGSFVLLAVVPLLNTVAAVQLLLVIMVCLVRKD